MPGRFDLAEIIRTLLQSRNNPAFDPAETIQRGAASAGPLGAILGNDLPSQGGISGTLPGGGGFGGFGGALSDLILRPGDQSSISDLVLRPGDRAKSIQPLGGGPNFGSSSNPLENLSSILQNGGFGGGGPMTLPGPQGPAREANPGFGSKLKTGLLRGFDQLRKPNTIQDILGASTGQSGRRELARIRQQRNIDRQFGLQERGLGIEEARLGLDQRRAELEAAKLRRELDDARAKQIDMYVERAAQIQDDEQAKRVLDFQLGAARVAPEARAYAYASFAALRGSQIPVDVGGQQIRTSPEKAIGVLQTGEKNQIEQAKVVDDRVSTLVSKGEVETVEAMREPLIKAIGQERFDTVVGEAKKVRLRLEAEKKLGTSEDAQRMFQRGATLSDNYESISKRFFQVRESFGKSQRTEPSGPGDIALIFNYMNIIDPGARVTEGDYATASNAGGVPESVRNLYNQLLNGEKLSPELREKYRNSARQQYLALKEDQKLTNDAFARRAKAYGVPVDAVIRSLDSPYEGKSGGVAGAEKRIEDMTDEELLEYYRRRGGQ